MIVVLESDLDTKIDVRELNELGMPAFWSVC